MYHVYKRTLVILCMSLFKVFNLSFPDRLIGYFLLIIIEIIDKSSHWKSNCEIVNLI